MQDTSNTQNFSNRRLYFYLLLSAALLLGICIGSYYYLKTTANQVLEFFPQMETAVLAGDSHQSLASYNQAKQTWDKHKNFWQCFLMHREIDDSEAMFFRLKGYLETGSITESLSSIYELQYNIDHVPDTERLSLYNIL